MQIYFVCGFSTCKDLAATVHLCQYLKWRYPAHFHYKKLVTSKACYKPFVKSLCRKFGWKEFTGSPMVWKQFGWYSHKGSATLLGDENKFQELMHEIYGVETFIPCEEKFNLAKDEHIYFLETNKLKNLPRTIERRIVCIYNAGHPATRILVAEILLSGREFQKKDGVEIRLVEETAGWTEEVDRCVQDAIYLNTETDTGENIIHSVKSLQEGILNCELLILMPEASANRDKSEQEHQMENLLHTWRHLACRLNALELSCKLLLFPTEDLCFKLTCLVEFFHKVRAFDIVGVTEDLGLNVLSQASEQSKLSKQSFLTIPPVWGFIGVKHLVDVCSIKLSHVRLMPDGNVDHETRQMMPYHDHLQPIWEERNSSAVNVLNQVSATVDLMNEWYSDKPTGRVFSAAVLSDGTFDIPSGLYFSQPVVCESHEWVPHKPHPLPQENLQLEDLYRDILPVLKEHQLGRKWNSIWLSNENKTSSQFLTADDSDTIDREIPEKPMTIEERYELRKYLGKRNQLYPESYKYKTPDIPCQDPPTHGRFSPRQEVTEDNVGVEILWDRKEPIEMDAAEKLDFLIDEYLAELMAEYGVGEEMIEEAENEEEISEEIVKEEED